MDLRRYLADEPVQACPPSAWYRFRKFARRNRAALVTMVLVSAALVLGTLVATWQAVRATHLQQLALRAERQAQKEAERAQQKAREAEQERRRAEAHLTLALLLVDLDPGLNNARTWLDRGRADSRSLLEVAQFLLAKNPGQEHAWKLLAVAYDALGSTTSAGPLRAGRPGAARPGQHAQPAGLVAGHV
jgi:type II secretory pathway pseudopilin PulG